jgi:hypothetical protein
MKNLNHRWNWVILLKMYLNFLNYLTFNNDNSNLFDTKAVTQNKSQISVHFNPLEEELNPIFHFLVSLGAHPVLHVSKIRVRLHLLCGAGGYPPNVLQPTETYCANPALVFPPSFPEALHIRRRERPLLARGGTMGEKYPIKFILQLRISP